MFNIEIVFWLALILTPTGSLLNALGYRAGFGVWTISNTILIYQAFYLEVLNLQLLYIFLLFTSVLGWFKMPRAK
jgi:hypothetical protein